MQESISGGGLQGPAAGRSGVSRRALVGGSVLTGTALATAATAASQARPAEASGLPTVGESDARSADPPTEFEQELAALEPTSTFFATVFIEHAGSVYGIGSDGDLWPSCWADDDHVYTSNGDGRGFSDETPHNDIAFNRVDGTPETELTGEKLAQEDEIGVIWGDPEEYNRKPTGLVCVDGVLYLAVQDLKRGEHAFDEAPTASIARSEDHGRTWINTDEPMFTDHRFTTVMFLDFGRDSEHAVPALGPKDGGYVYAYGLDWNWRGSASGLVPDPTSLYLARVPARAVQERDQWRFFTGTDKADRPRWSPDMAAKRPVLTDPVRRVPDWQLDRSGNASVIAQGGVLYNAALERYLYTSWTNPTFEFYESPTPWGPWRRFLCHNSGQTDWRDREHPEGPKNGGYATSIPAKYVHADGQTMWVQSNWWRGPVPTPEVNYNFNLRKLTVTPYRRRPATNRRRSADNVAVSGADVTVIQRCARNGHYDYLNDGDLTRSESSFDGSNKRADFWGYTFSREYRMNRLEYTTGRMDDDGGWFTNFGGGLTVEVRQEFSWVKVTGLSISPDYPFDDSAGDFTTYTVTFDDIAGDGVRIVGPPGGRAFYTSIAELEVYYD